MSGFDIHLTSPLRRIHRRSPRGSRYARNLCLARALRARGRTFRPGCSTTFAGLDTTTRSNHSAYGVLLTSFLLKSGAPSVHQTGPRSPSATFASFTRRRHPRHRPPQGDRGVRVGRPSVYSTRPLALRTSDVDWPDAKAALGQQSSDRRASADSRLCQRSTPTSFVPWMRRPMPSSRLSASAWSSNTLPKGPSVGTTHTHEPWQSSIASRS